MNKTVLGSILGYFSAGELNKSKILGAIIGGIGGNAYSEVLNYFENKNLPVISNQETYPWAIQQIRQENEGNFIEIKVHKDKLNPGQTPSIGGPFSTFYETVRIQLYPNENPQHAIMRFERELDEKNRKKQEKKEYKQQLRLALEMKRNIHHGTWRTVANWENQQLPELRKLRSELGTRLYAKDSGYPHYLTKEEIENKIIKFESDIETVKFEFKSTFGFDVFTNIDYNTLFTQIQYL